MNIYKITQAFNDGCDTYDSMIVVAETEHDAKKCTTQFVRMEKYTWAAYSHLYAELIGQAPEGKYEKSEVILASYNAS